MHRINREPERFQTMRSQDFQILRFGHNYIVTTCIAIGRQENGRQVTFHRVPLDGPELKPPHLLHAERL